MKVFVVHYTHKHGCDISVFGTRDEAERAATSIMLTRANRWDHSKTEEFRESAFSPAGFNELLGTFHDVERNISYGEVIELMERKVQ